MGKRKSLVQEKGRKDLTTVVPELGPVERLVDVRALAYKLTNIVELSAAEFKVLEKEGLPKAQELGKLFEGSTPTSRKFDGKKGWA